MFHISCLGIWWHHDIWISEKLKFDYLKNEKSFRGEIKKHSSLVSLVLSFKYIKTDYQKCVVDTNFKTGNLLSKNTAEKLHILQINNENINAINSKKKKNSLQSEGEIVRKN